MSCPMFPSISAAEEAGGKSEVDQKWFQHVWHQQASCWRQFGTSKIPQHSPEPMKDGREELDYILTHTHPPHKFIPTRYWEFTSVPHWQADKTTNLSLDSFSSVFLGINLQRSSGTQTKQHDSAELVISPFISLQLFKASSYFPFLPITQLN